MQSRFHAIYISRAWFLAAGVILGFGAHVLQHPAHVSAQGNTLTQAPCNSTVPVSWGKFQGGSSLGLAFEDSAGTVRVIRNPQCLISGTGFGATQLIPDLKIERK